MGDYEYSKIREPAMQRGGTHREDLIAWALDVLIDHYEKYPKHGPGCACSDIISYRLRNAFRSRKTEQYVHQESEHIQKAYRTLSGIFYRLGQEH